MSRPLPVLAVPCGSCPYRCDTPVGVWDESEYEKLRQYAPGELAALPHLGLFLCHQTHFLGQATLCRGWLTVEADSVAVQLALCQGKVTPEQVAAPVAVPLYASGEAAAQAGLAAVRKPPPAARRLAARLGRKGLGRRQR